MDSIHTFETQYASDVAIIGMAGRFPGAQNISEFWHNLCAGIESISFFSDEELGACGVGPDLLRHPNYVKAGGILPDVEMFDAAFFGFNPREAMLLDPQHRLFLECAWEVMESAGYDPERSGRRVGVYAGVSKNTYLLYCLSSYPELFQSIDEFQLMIAADKDHLSTRVSYKLNLKGPSVTVQTACSTSLVAVHLACQSLLNGECNMALAGGVTISIPQQTGYLYREGSISSPDGHCRAFDAKAQGTVGGNGVGVVLLKRLADALAGGDHIWAVIKGSAINNDGSAKVGYTAPSVEGQAEAIAEAQALAGVDPETITYVEAHGTGTVLGDPIEIEALTRAFRWSTSKKGFCAIGSVKTNLGHLDTAAGVTGLIKTALALKYGEIPPSLHFERSNPKIDFDNSPFYVNTELRDWDVNGHPRRAGVSSFGIGGTNAHVVLEEAPVIEPSGDSRPWHLLLLSAKTSKALKDVTANLVRHLRAQAECNLADVAYTLQVGRRFFPHRRALVCQNVTDCVSALETLDTKRVLTAFEEPRHRPLVFMFPGQGAQHVNMGRGLYEGEPVFRKAVNRCVSILKPLMGLDLLEVLYPDVAEESSAAERLAKTEITQPALFVIEYALAELWREWGLRPSAMIGHSIGEIVAASQAGVFELESALELVVERGRLIQELAGGSMLSVSLSEAEIQPLLGDRLALAAVNGPRLCTVSGAGEAIEKLQTRLEAQGIACRRLRTSHAFHSTAMEPILDEFAACVERANPRPPSIPFVSNVTGDWITAEEATDPQYWARHVRQTVRFADGLRALLAEQDHVFLEVGPGHTLHALARRQKAQAVVTSMRHPRDERDDMAHLLHTLGQLWVAGVTIDWHGFYEDERHLRVPLPTYPFERQRCWIEPAGTADALPQQAAEGKKANPADWFYEGVWETSALPQVKGDVSGGWLVLEGAAGRGAAIAQALSERGASVVQARPGEAFARAEDGVFTLRPDAAADYGALLDALEASGATPTRIIHLWSLGESDASLEEVEAFQAAQRMGFYSLLYLAQALGERNQTQSLQIVVVSNNVLPIKDGVVWPEKATMLGPCLVIPQEYPNIRCRLVDVALPGEKAETALVSQVVEELTAPASDPAVAYRDGARYVQRFVPRRQTAELGAGRLRPSGVYLIVGGLGNIGLTLAGYLAEQVQARLVLTSRSGLPAREAWDKWLAGHTEEDATSRKIKAVQGLEAAGAEVLVLAADVSDEVQMRAAIEDARARFGGLNGVIHAAGQVENAARLIHLIKRADCESQFVAKVEGVYVLGRVLEDEGLDFCFVCSSLSAVLGGLGYVAYAAANQFLDAYTHTRNDGGEIAWISVNWDAWDFSGVERETTGGRGMALAELAMTPEEGQRAFALALGSGAAQLVHSTGDLEARLRRWVQWEPVRDVSIARRATHPRPALASDYVEPRNELETTIAALWGDLLGVEQVGIHDNFFELGGDSLVAIQFLSRLREMFRVNLQLAAVLTVPTVAELAIAIEIAIIEEIEGLGLGDT